MLGTPDISVRLRDVRRLLKKTLREVADDAGITDSHYSFMEKGKRKVTDRTIKVICSVYGIDERWLRVGEGEPFDRATTQENRSFDELALLEKFRRFPPDLQRATLVFCDSVLASLERGRADDAL